MKKDIHTEIITYTCDGKAFKGFLAAPTTEGKAPGVLIAPAWRGLDEFARKKAVALAELGYVALAADPYGNGTTAESDEEAARLNSSSNLFRFWLKPEAGYWISTTTIAVTMILSSARGNRIFQPRCMS